MKIQIQICIPIMNQTKGFLPNISMRELIMTSRVRWKIAIHKTENKLFYNMCKLLSFVKVISQLKELDLFIYSHFITIKSTTRHKFKYFPRMINHINIFISTNFTHAHFFMQWILWQIYHMGIYIGRLLFGQCWTIQLYLKFMMGKFGSLFQDHGDTGGFLQQKYSFHMYIIKTLQLGSHPICLLIVHLRCLIGTAS